MRLLPALYGRFGRDERGSVMPLVALCMTVILGFAALAIDVGSERVLHNQLEATADAAALAAATQLPNEKKALAKALEYAVKNMPPEANGTVLTDEDVVFGTWYEGRREFVAGGPFTNAVQVTVRRAEKNGNPAPTFFLHIFGQDHADISAQSLAGVVVFGNLPRGGFGNFSAKERAKLQEMEDALQKEAQYRWNKSSHNPDDMMNDRDTAEFLMENYGKPALLQ
jgi:Flp pilus assembly protein TadG